MNGKVLYSEGQNNECYTPPYGIRPLLPYVPKGAVIWCPFDTEQSQFVRVLREAGHTVTHSHISEGKDFFEYEPERWDVIISNPPFSGKRQTFERALSFNRPFCLLMTNTWLNDSAPKQLFAERDLQLLMFDKRIEFQGQKKITFSSSYYCWNFLPKQIVMARLEKV